MPGQTDLTRHFAQPRRYFTRDLLSGREARGYTAMDLFKFYGLIAGLLFFLAYTYTRYWELFNEIGTAGAGRQLFVLLFSGLPLLLVFPALLGFLWWASGALVSYARWQRPQAALWRWFWFGVLNFYTWVLLDLADAIHPVMSRKGLAPAPNLVLLFDGKFELFQFQWGYFLLYALFWFLVIALHWSYFADGLRELRFHVDRMQRYSASVLTGFAQTAAAAASRPVSIPLEQLAGAGRGAPRLNPEIAGLDEALAARIQAADASGSISAAPGQPGVLFVDLASWSPSPALAALTDAQGRPLLVFDAPLPQPQGRREDFVVPLLREVGP